jgi:hypothetical protein
MMFGWKASINVRGERHQIWDETILKKYHGPARLSASRFSQPLLTTLTLSLRVVRARIEAHPRWEQELVFKPIRAGSRSSRQSSSMLGARITQLWVSSNA